MRFFKIFAQKLAFYALDMEPPSQNPTVNCQKSEVGTGTLTFQKSEPNRTEKHRIRIHNTTVLSGAAREAHCRHPERVWGGQRRGEESGCGPGRRALLRVAGTQAGAGRSF